MNSKIELQAQRQPILIPFQPDMVRAIITCAKCGHLSIPFPCEKCGSAEFVKTQTRRICARLYDGSWCLDPDDSDEDKQKLIEACTYGKAETKLLVREKLVKCQDSEGSIPVVLYDVLRSPVECENNPVVWKWKPSVLPSRYMPRWAARIPLINQGVRFEHVQDISEEDARAEGAPGIATHKPYARQYRDSYRELWNLINEKRGFGWDANPWVWCITFKRV
jgi:hypothetical protein